MGNACGKRKETLTVSDSSILDVTLIDKGIVMTSSGQKLASEEISEIIDRSKDILKQNDDNFLAHLKIGICLFVMGYYEVSENHLIKAQQLSKSYQGSYVLGLIALSKKNFKESQSCFYSCINEISLPCAYIKLGEVLLRRSKFALARRVIKKGLLVNQDQGELMTILGMTYLPTDLKKASKYTKKAIKLNPDLFKPYINLAEIRKAQEKYDHSIKYYQKALEKGNYLQKGFAQLLLASLYFEIGKLEEAINFCKESIISNPSLIEIMKTKGFDCIFNDSVMQNCVESIITKDYENAIDKLRYLYKNNKSSVPICYFLAVAYFETEHYRKSKRYYRKIINLSIAGENNQLGKLLLARAETVLHDIAMNEVNQELPLDTAKIVYADTANSPEILSGDNVEKIEKDNVSEEDKIIQEDNEEEEEVLTLEGSYPNFIDAKADEIVENVVPAENNSREPPRFFTSTKHNSLRQFAASTDPEPGNCLIF